MSCPKCKCINTETHHDSATLNKQVVEILDIIQRLEFHKQYWSERDEAVADEIVDSIDEYCQILKELMDLNKVPSIVKPEER